MAYIRFLCVCRVSATVRLRGGPHPWSGRVEVYQNGNWATLCNKHWNRRSAGIVCQQLGFGGVAHIHHLSRFEMGTGPMVMTSGSCSGAEETLQECPLLSWSDCDHTRDAGVECSKLIRHKHKPRVKFVHLWI